MAAELQGSHAGTARLVSGAVLQRPASCTAHRVPMCVTHLVMCRDSENSALWQMSLIESKKYLSPSSRVHHPPQAEGKSALKLSPNSQTCQGGILKRELHQAPRLLGSLRRGTVPFYVSIRISADSPLETTEGHTCCRRSELM